MEWNQISAYSGPFQVHTACLICTLLVGMENSISKIYNCTWIMRLLVQDGTMSLRRKKKSGKVCRWNTKLWFHKWEMQESTLNAQKKCDDYENNKPGKHPWNVLQCIVCGSAVLQTFLDTNQLCSSKLLIPHFESQQF